MTRCGKAFDVDLAALLHRPDDPELAEFRAHYPGCADCDAEVGVWRELDRALRSDTSAAAPDDGLGDAHPTPEELLAFADAPDGLRNAERNALTAHVAGCRACADELRALAAFDVEALASPAGATIGVGARAAHTDRRGDHVRRDAHVDRTARRRPFAAGVKRVLLHPAFAYALVVALLVPAFGGWLSRLREPALDVAARGGRSGAAGDLGAARSERRASKTEMDVEQRAAESATERDRVAAAPEPRPGAPALADERRPDSVADGEAGNTDAPALLTAERVPHAQPGGQRRNEVSGTAADSPRESRGTVTSEAPERASRDVEEGWTLVDLDACEPTRVALYDLQNGLILRVPRGTDDADTPIEIRLVAAGDRKEIRQRDDTLQAPAAPLAEPPAREADAAKLAAKRMGSTAKQDVEGPSVRVPAASLAAGEYRVEVRSLRGAGATAEYTLIVR